MAPIAEPKRKRRENTYVSVILNLRGDGMGLATVTFTDNKSDFALTSEIYVICIAPPITDYRHCRGAQDTD
jgi:hypothetical protein